MSIPPKDPEPASCQGLVLMQALGPLGGPRDRGSHAPSLCLAQIPLRSCPAGPPAQLTAPQSPSAALITLGLGWQLSSLGLSFASARHSPTPGFLGHSSCSLLAAGRGAPGEWVRAPSRAQDQLGKAPLAIVLESRGRETLLRFFKVLLSQPEGGDGTCQASPVRIRGYCVPPAQDAHCRLALPRWAEGVPVTQRQAGESVFGPLQISARVRVSGEMAVK